MSLGAGFEVSDAQATPVSLSLPTVFGSRCRTLQHHACLLRAAMLPSHQDSNKPLNCKPALLVFL